jgi:hypothetical protein
MLVIMQKFVIRPGRAMAPGHQYDLPDDLARSLIENDQAVEVTSNPEPLQQSTIIETAALSAADHNRKTITRRKK